MRKKKMSLNLAQIYGEECSFGGMELANPCDVDYKSKLSVGKFPDISISDLLNSKAFIITIEIFI